VKAEEMAQGGLRKKSNKGAAAKANGRLGALLHDTGAGPNAGMYWDDVDPRIIAWLVVQMQRLSGAVTFGRSRDGGALMITLLLDGDRETVWINPHDDAEQKLTGLCERLDTVVGG
jgi:hypothetical protein